MEEGRGIEGIQGGKEGETELSAVRRGGDMIVVEERGQKIWRNSKRETGANGGRVGEEAWRKGRRGS